LASLITKAIAVDAIRRILHLIYKRHINDEDAVFVPGAGVVVHSGTAVYNSND
jgi:hypothetical protein